MRTFQTTVPFLNSSGVEAIKCGMSNKKAIFTGIRPPYRIIAISGSHY